MLLKLSSSNRKSEFNQFIPALVWPLLLLPFSVVEAQEESAKEPGNRSPQKWLDHFVGNWEAVSRGQSGENQPPVESTGTIVGTRIGDHWLMNRMEVRVMDMKITGVQMIGYSSEKKKFVGTWVDSMTSFMWQYEGTLSNDGKTLTLEAKGPSAVPDQLTLYQDVYHFKATDLIEITSRVQDANGKWVTYMTGTAKRQSKQ